MGKSAKPLIVISGVNLVEGGPLSVFKDAVRTFQDGYSDKYDFVLIVHSRKLFLEFDVAGTRFFEYKWVKRSWLLRLWFEYILCYFISLRLKPFMWLSLHDITPTVVARKKVLYCHNPAPFYKVSLKEAKLEPGFLLFSLFYKILYRINIKSNDYIIVQQQWLRELFIKNFGLRNVIVAHPNTPSLNTSIINTEIKKKTFSFFYPAFPRVFKNFETLMEAVKILLKTRKDFEVIITMAGNENAYSRHLYEQYRLLENVKFIGLQSRENVVNLYRSVNCLVFPSKLETWGLPISEMKFFNKPIIVANEKYAKESVGVYRKVKFFETKNPSELAKFMKQAIEGVIEFDINEYQIPKQPFSENWKELAGILLA